MSASKQHSNPNMISEAVRRNGYCGEVSANGEWVCIKDAGHDDAHGDERWGGDDFSILRNYLFDGIGNDALTRIEEQLEAAPTFNVVIRDDDGEPITVWFVTETEMIAFIHLWDAIQRGSNPASEPKAS